MIAILETFTGVEFTAEINVIFQSTYMVVPDPLQSTKGRNDSTFPVLSSTSRRVQFTIAVSSTKASMELTPLSMS